MNATALIRAAMRTRLGTVHPDVLPDCPSHDVATLSPESPGEVGAPAQQGCGRCSHPDTDTATS